LHPTGLAVIVDCLLTQINLTALCHLSLRFHPITHTHHHQGLSLSTLTSEARHLELVPVIVQRRSSSSLRPNLAQEPHPPTGIHIRLKGKVRRFP
jgi:hypothetical protein